MNDDRQQRVRPATHHLVPGLLTELRRLRNERGNGGRFSMLSDVLLRDALRERVTDVHFDPQADRMVIRFRIDGRLYDASSLSLDHGIHLIRHFKALSNLDPANNLRLADARISYGLDGTDLDLRIACAPTIAGEKLSIRVLDRMRVQQRLDQLGLANQHEDQITQWLAGTSGMFLVVGPTGSGKTTTAYALLHELKEAGLSVVTIEDPVECQIAGISQMQVDHHRSLSFAEALKGMLRLDPDYVFVGEIRDAATAGAAVEASGAGRVVMSTFHSPDAVGTITALRNFGLSDEGICSAVRMVVAQRLVRRLCPLCRRQEPPTEADLRSLRTLGVTEPIEKVWVSTGCDKCQGIGYSGRVGVFEVWRLSDADSSLILDHADVRTLRRHLAETGFRTMASDGWEKATDGHTSHTELRALGSVVSNQDNRSSGTMRQAAAIHEPV